MNDGTFQCVIRVPAPLYDAHIKELERQNTTISEWMRESMACASIDRPDIPDTDITSKTWRRLRGRVDDDVLAEFQSYLRDQNRTRTQWYCFERGWRPALPSEVSRGR